MQPYLSDAACGHNVLSTHLKTSALSLDEATKHAQLPSPLTNTRRRLAELSRTLLNTMRYLSDKSDCMPNTLNALLARGIDSNTAQQLVDNKYTIGKLKQADPAVLSAFGLSSNQIETVQKGQRPPIPAETAYSLLYACRRTCCICRNTSRPIIIHHIEPWTDSKSHDESNLAVLCLEHHDLAHTKKDLSLALKPDEIRAAKTAWLDQTKLMDARAILGLAESEHARWDYFNYNRFFELMTEVNPKFNDIRFYTDLRRIGILNNRGTIANESDWNVDIDHRYFRTDFNGAHFFNSYMKELARRVFSNVEIIDLTNRLTPFEIRSLLKPGQFFAFKPDSDTQTLTPLLIQTDHK